MKIGQRLRRLRAAKGLSQGHIEEHTGLLRCYISRVECEHTVPNLTTLGKWAKALDLELYQLFYFGPGEPQAPESTEPVQLGTEERKLLSVFGRLGQRDKALLLSMARTLAIKGRPGC